MKNIKIIFIIESITYDRLVLKYIFEKINCKVFCTETRPTCKVIYASGNVLPVKGVVTS